MTEPNGARTSTSGGGSGTAPPAAPPGTATPPGPGPNWAWRDRGRRRDTGGVFFGLLLVLLGGYFLLRDTLDVQLPSLGELWPIILIALGLWFVVAAMRRNDAG